ncbi:MAG: asparagine synthase (glutamine-hydrolyzing) [Thermodesulfobacteriota bacterium]
MCGIWGWIESAGNQPERDKAERMGRAIAKRGPDQVGVYEGPGVYLGMNRLAIIDVAGGDQPIYNQDRSRMIFYNGEVYNHRELRRELERLGYKFRTNSDTETVLNAYEAWGPDCLGRLNGMFAFAVYEPETRKLFLARDRLGIKPLYYRLEENRLLFGSDAKALLPAMAGAVRPDWPALWRYLSFGYMPREDAAFAGVKKLPAGHLATYQDGRWSMRPYWRPSYPADNPISWPQALEETRRLIEQAVKRELMSDVPLGLFLSGGLDSSAVALYARKHLPGRVKTFAIGFTEKTHDESEDARLMAAHLGLDHQELLFTHELLRENYLEVAGLLSEPFGDSTVAPLLHLCRQTRKEVTVVLTGWGGDESFAGYPTYQAHVMAAWWRRLAPSVVTRKVIRPLVDLLPPSRKYMSLEFKAKRFLSGMELSPEMQHLVWMGYFAPEELPRLFTPELAEVARCPVWGQVEAALPLMDAPDLVGRILQMDGLFFLEGNGLFQADRISMEASLEARVPLLNNELIDFLFSLPTRMKIGRASPKRLMREALRPLLPRRIIDKPKKGFGPPSGQWLRGPLAEIMSDALAAERIKRQGFFQPQFVERLVSEHLAGRRDHGRVLWALLSLQLWHQNFIEASH